MSGLLFRVLHAENPAIDGEVLVSQVPFSDGISLSSDKLVAYGGPHWIDVVNNDDPTDAYPDGNPDKDDSAAIDPDKIKSYPYAYVSNSKPTVEAVFVPKGSPEGPFTGSGSASGDNLSFTLKEKPLDGLTYKAETAPENIVTSRKIEAYLTGNRGGPWSLNNPVTITWEVKDKNGKVVGAGSSKHTIYVTWDEPTTGSRQETLFNLSCRNADGNAVVGNGKNIFDDIWEEFKSKAIKNMNGKTLAYWKTANAGPTFTDLLSTEDGRRKTGDGRREMWGMGFISL